MRQADVFVLGMTVAIAGPMLVLLVLAAMGAG
jgi:hypothetical protein